MEKANGKNGLSLQEICDQWVNFSSFLARTIAAGFQDRIFRAKYPTVAFKDALDVTTGPRRDCVIRVAAQHVLLCGHHLAKYRLNNPKDKEGPRLWKLWAERLWEISQTHENSSLASVAEDAFERMVLLYQEGFPVAVRAAVKAKGDSSDDTDGTRIESVMNSGANGASTNTTVDVENADTKGPMGQWTVAVKAIEVAQADAAERAFAWWMALRSNASKRSG